MQDVSFRYEYDFGRELTTREKLLANARNIQDIEEELKRYNDLTEELERLKKEEKELLRTLLNEEA